VRAALLISPPEPNHPPSSTPCEPPMRRMARRALGFAIVVAAFTGPLSGLKAGEARSGETRMQVPLLPGVDTDDSRGRLDTEKGPWRAVGKLQVATVNRRQSDEAQRLTVVDKGADGQTSVRELIPVRFSRLETVV
jgi:hypothetical protein